MTRRFLPLIVAVLAVLLAACSRAGSADSGYGSPTATPPPASSPAPAQPPAAVATAQSSLGQTLVDAGGRTLYAFTKDNGGKSSCYGDCEATWPALTVQGSPSAGDGVEASLLATTDRKDGSAQVTYKGMPLYHFSGDQQPGDTNGQGVGGVWFVVGSNGALVRSAAKGGTDDGYGYP
jgi:predicted lipoprotein with Yx(FWY)xxD motif